MFPLLEGSIPGWGTNILQDKWRKWGCGRAEICELKEKTNRDNITERCFFAGVEGCGISKIDNLVARWLDGEYKGKSGWRSHRDKPCRPCHLF